MEKDCGAWINLLSHKVKTRLDATLLDLGITSMQSRVIYYVLVHFKEGPVLQRDIESVFGLSRSTTTGILQQLEKKDIIRREGVASDARLKSLVPTQHAVELNAQVYACLRETDRMLTRGLSGGQLQLFKETAAQMLQNLEDWDGFSDDAAAENPKQSVPSCWGQKKFVPEQKRRCLPQKTRKNHVKEKEEHHQ